MNRIILSLAVATAILTANECESMLSQSLKVTDACLTELEHNQEELESAKLYSATKVSAILDTNEDLKMENTELLSKNNTLNIINKELLKKNEQLEKDLTIAKAGKLAMRNRMESQKSRLASYISNKKSNFDTRSVPKEKIVPTNYEKINIKNKSYLHQRSKTLEAKFKEKSDLELLKKYIFRVSVGRLNVRAGHSSRYTITSVVNRNELIEFSNIYVIKRKYDSIVWVETKAGWMCIPSKNTPAMLEIIKNIKHKKTKVISQKAGGVKG